MHVVKAATLSDTQMERIVKAADPKAVIFHEETRVIDGETIKEKRLCERWINWRNELLYFEALYRDDVRRRAAPAEVQKEMNKIVTAAKKLAALVAGNPRISHHRDALSRLITDASAPPSKNPELDERDKSSAFKVMVRGRLAPSFHEHTGRLPNYTTNPDTDEVSSPFVSFALAVTRELDIRTPDGLLPDGKTIKAVMLGYKTKHR